MSDWKPDWEEEDEMRSPEFLAILVLGSVVTAGLISEIGELFARVGSLVAGDAAVASEIVERLESEKFLKRVFDRARDLGPHHSALMRDEHEEREFLERYGRGIDRMEAGIGIRKPAGGRPEMN